MDDEVGRELQRLERDLVSDALGVIEHGLACDDPAFLRRFHAVRRAEIANVVSVITLLVIAVACLAVGVATASWQPWVAGFVVFFACFAVDEHHRSTLRRGSKDLSG
jgi:hypothetical protein